MVSRALIKELFIADLTPELLANFERYQEVKKCWRKDNDIWVLKNIAFTEKWSESKKQTIVSTELTECVLAGGAVFAGFNGQGQAIAFAAVSSTRFGNENQYVQLTQLHVSAESRNKGMGKELFEHCIKKAREYGASKLYVSAHSSEESQCFYRGVGFVEAFEPNKEIIAIEPYDCQMEYLL